MRKCDFGQVWTALFRKFYFYYAFLRKFGSGDFLQDHIAAKLDTVALPALFFSKNQPMQFSDVSNWNPHEAMWTNSLAGFKPISLIFHHLKNGYLSSRRLLWKPSRQSEISSSQGSFLISEPSNGFVVDKSQWAICAHFEKLSDQSPFPPEEFGSFSSFKNISIQYLG